MNEKIDKLIEFFNLNVIDGNKYEVFGEDETFVFTKNELRERIRKILGIDKQCFQCSEYHFDGDLSLVEGTSDLVCQGCAEKIISGEVKVKEV